jgi:hypothetical protein
VSPRDPAEAHASVPPGPDVAAALARVRAVFGPVQVLAVRAHDPDPGPAAQPALVQGRLGLDQEAS